MSDPAHRPTERPRRPGAFEPEPDRRPRPERPPKATPFDLLRIALLVVIALLLTAMFVLDLPLWMIGGKAILVVGLVAMVVFLSR